MTNHIPTIGELRKKAPVKKAVEGISLLQTVALTSAFVFVSMTGMHVLDNHTNLTTASVLSPFSQSAKVYKDAWENLKAISQAQVSKEENQTPIIAGQVAQSKSVQLAQVSAREVIQPLNLESLRQDLLSYIDSKLSGNTPPPVTQDIQPAIHYTVTRQGDSDSDNLSSYLTDILTDGVFSNAILTNSTISGPSGSFSSLNFSSATGSDLYLNGNLTVAGDTTTIGQLVSTRIPTLPHVFTTWPDGDSNASDATIYLNPSSAAPDTNIFAAAVNGAVKFLVDAEGDIYGNNLVLTGSTSQGETTIAGNLTVQDHTTLGDASTDLVTIVGALRLGNLTTVTRDALTPLAGYTIFNTTASKMQVYNGSSWKNVGNPEIGAEVTSGTNGSVLFVDSSGNLAQDNTNFTFTDSTNTLNIANLISTNSTSTSATSTSLFSTTASSTNLYSSLLSVGGSAGLNVISGGNVGIGTTNPSAPLHLSANGGAGYLAELVNSNVYGLRIKTTGTTSGHQALWVEDNTSNIFNVMATGQVYMKGNVGIGTTNPISVPGVERVLQIDGISAGLILNSTHASGKKWEIYAENSGDVVWYDGNDLQVRIRDDDSAQNDDGWVTGAADYGEFMKKLDPNEEIGIYDVVGVKGGKITKNTDGATLIMVASTDAGIRGGNPMISDYSRDDDPDWVVVAFVGQMPVVVDGEVEEGDYLIPSGLHNGRAKAVSRGNISKEQMSQVIGIALEDDINPVYEESNPFDVGPLSPDSDSEINRELYKLNQRKGSGHIINVGIGVNNSGGGFSISAFFDEIWGAVVSKLADAANGITDLFAKSIHSDIVHTQTICVGDGSGTETCLSKNQLDALIANTGSGATIIIPEEEVIEEDGTATTTEEVIEEDDSATTTEETIIEEEPAPEPDPEI